MLVAEREALGELDDEPEDGWPAQPSDERGAAERLLALDDASLGAALVGSLCVKHPTARNFAALGRLVRAGRIEDLRAALSRGGPAPSPGQGDLPGIG